MVERIKKCMRMKQISDEDEWWFDICVGKITNKDGKLSDKEILGSLSELKKIYEGIENDVQLLIEKLEYNSSDTVFSEDIQGKLLDLLYIIPCGPLSIHPEIRAYSFASTNIGILKTTKDFIRIRMLHRSFNKYYNEKTCEEIITLLKMTGLEMNRTITGSYPPWEPKFDSRLLKLAKDAHFELYNKEPRIILIQGGLECTLLININPEMEAMAMDPTTRNVHSPNERLNVKSVGNTWNLLLKILKKID